MIYAALTIGIIVGITLGAVLIDLWFVQPLARDNHQLHRHVKRVQVNSDMWREMAEHRGTPYLNETVERAKVEKLLRDITASLEDTHDHSKAAELRVV